MSMVELPQPNSEAPPLRVHTLGRFVIERDGEAIPQGTKSQRKPLDLLKLLIALGGQSISVDTLSEALWPDSDGDRAQGSFSTTLHRLRKLIGQEALSLGNARLSLDPSQCWVDAWAFANLVKQAAKALEAADHAAAWEFTEQALEVYRGPFLDGEFDLAEVLTAREKLHSQFLGHVSKLGAAGCEAGEHGKAIALYEKGLEIDEVAEEFYQNLMRCHQRSGRVAEAISVYQRCKDILKSAAGIEPSPETVALRASLDSASDRPPVVPETGGDERPAAPPPARDRPSIAVLAFENMSDDPEQEYFSDGLSEDIITDLSSISGLLVIARYSSFVYKGKTVDVRQVGQELGAGYVLEGSVRKSGNRVRITAQLIDAATGNHMWAKRFDRTLEDIFAVQDEITEEIVTALNVNLLEGELQLVWRKYLKTREARAVYRFGAQFFRRPTKEGNVTARREFEQVMTLEPESPAGYNGMGWSHWWDARYGWSEDPASSLALASDLARKSLQKDSKYPVANSLLASVFLLEGEFERAIELGKQAEVLAPNHAHIVAFLAGILNYSGNPKEAIAKAQKAIRLIPSTPSWYLALLASAHYGCGGFEEAIRAAREGIAKNQEEVDAGLYKAASHEALGQHDEAVQEVKTVLEAVPDLSLAAFAKTQPYKDRAVLDGLLDLLRKAGLPEGKPSPSSEPLADIASDHTQPGIAVLAFENMSGDPEQEYFSDGISEDIITDLSRLSRLAVTAHSTAFTYKGKAVNVEQVGKELRVKYVLEGSVRKVGNRVRITAQLIDVATGTHIWAERFDRELDDIFQVQDEITHSIVTALDVKLLEGEQAKFWRNSTQNAEAYDLFLQGQNHYRSNPNPEGYLQTRRLFEQAVELDPNFARAIAALAHTHTMDLQFAVGQNPQDSLDKSFALANRAIALDDSLAFGYSVLGLNYALNGQPDRAIAEAMRAAKLNPNSGDIVARLGVIETHCGQPASAVRTFRKAMLLTPHYPSWYLRQLGLAQICLNHYQEAIASLKESISGTPDSLSARIFLAIAYAAVELEREAETEVQEILRLEPDYNLGRFKTGYPFDSNDEAPGESMVALLRKAGLK